MNTPMDYQTRKAQTLHLEGKVTVIKYEATKQAATASAFQIFKNYEKQLKNQNAEIIFSCRNETCFIDGAANHGVFINNWINENKLIFKGIQAGIQEDFGILTAKITKNSGQTVHVMIALSAHPSNSRRVISMSIIESETMDTDKLKIVTKTDLENKISTTGKITLDGIYFDHDKSTIKSKSNEALDAIQSYLELNDNKFFVVGHTDNSGAYDYNIDLSKKRAKSVVAALISRGIAPEKLTHIGIGPVSPKALNSSEQGMALNRRVELVLK